jgi:hypothetical protein
MKKAKLGSGKRFSKLEKSVEKEGYSEKSAKAIAASVGRKKYGDKKMQTMAKVGKIKNKK